MIETSRINDVVAFDFHAPAEVYASRRRGKSAVRYRRFATAAEAVRFAIEELPPPLLLGTFLEVKGERFDGAGIRALYEQRDYPLARGTELGEPEFAESPKRLE